MTTLYSASWVLPVSSSPIEDGAIAISGDRIVDLGARSLLKTKFPAAETRDFGTAAIIPGLVNAHSHLELTAMRGFLDSEESDFTAWLRKLTFARLERMTTAPSAADQLSEVPPQAVPRRSSASASVDLGRERPPNDRKAESTTPPVPRKL